ncbi:hypothetical protein BJ165DRAFT_1345832 [Panaeolus papilionaceus]|nr:hypothetical protein BJ165DRAFT_1345832 [Panaeolus papilionaceus]
MPPAPRYTSIVKHLVQCPPEIVHEIIGDLSIAKILDILSIHNNAYLDECVSSHLVLGAIFPAQVLAEAREYFTIYTRLAVMMQHKRIVNAEPSMRYLLAFDGVQFRSKNRDILQILREPVLKRMEAYHPFLPVLQHYSAQPIPDAATWKTLESAAKIGEVFRLLDETETKINAKKAEQLGRMASLVEKHPEKLQSRNDWSQEGRRNSQHLVTKLLVWKRDMVRRSTIAGSRIVALSAFAVPDLYVVPYIRFEQVQPKVRTKYTLFSARNERNPRGYNQPVFASSYVGYEKWADPVAACIPAPDRELDWLESFLHICDYMGSMQVEMISGQTVAAFWEIHT